VFDVRDKRLEGSIEVLFKELSSKEMQRRSKHGGCACKKEDWKDTKAYDERGKII